jgi:DNA topoisomerase-1
MSTNDTATLYVGDGTVVEDATDRREFRGRIVVLAKPDGTVLVHDHSGYQPVAWLTRADAVTVTDDDAFRLTAHDERADDWLRVTGHDTPSSENGRNGHESLASLSGQYPVSPAGEPIGRCPSCDGALVDRTGTVACVHCDRSHAYPDDATIRPPSTATASTNAPATTSTNAPATASTNTPASASTTNTDVLDASDAMTDGTDDGPDTTPGGRTCECGLPRMRVERGVAVDCCVDRNCEPLDDLVSDALDREFDCPACDGDLLVERERGLFLACEDRPTCDTAFYVPSGVQDGHCDCGLPAFAGSSGRRCLDATCDRT